MCCSPGPPVGLSREGVSVGSGFIDGPICHGALTGRAALGRPDSPGQSTTILPHRAHCPHLKPLPESKLNLCLKCPIILIIDQNDICLDYLGVMNGPLDWSN